MAETYGVTFSGRIGYWIKTSIGRQEDFSDSISFSETIAVNVIFFQREKISLNEGIPHFVDVGALVGQDEWEIGILEEEDAPWRGGRPEFFYLLEEISVFAVGGRRTLFISDERYFRRRG
jgi:hypothetical protein